MGDRGLWNRDKINHTTTVCVCINICFVILPVEKACLVLYNESIIPFGSFRPAVQAEELYFLYPCLRYECENIEKQENNSTHMWKMEPWERQNGPHIWRLA